MTPEQKYRKDPRLNASTLKMWLGDPRVAYYGETNPQTDTRSLSLGRAVHKVLEHKMDRNCLTVSPYDSYRTKDARAWRDANPDALKQSEADEAYAIAEAVYESLEGQILDDYENGEHEKDMYTETKKALMDLVCEGRGYDWKTTSSTDLKGVIRDFDKYGYHLQAAHYLDVGDLESFTFVVVSVVAPHPVWIMTCSADYLEYGRDAVTRAETARSSYVPDDSAMTHTLEAPHWFTPDPWK